MIDLRLDLLLEEYLFQFVAMGLEGIEQVWIRHGFQESTEEIIEQGNTKLG